jgi:hypothetical protein
MENIEQQCASAMNRLIETGKKFSKEDFYALLVKQDFTPMEIKRLWNATRRDFEEVGLIQRAGNGDYQGKERETGS